MNTETVGTADALLKVAGTLESLADAIEKDAEAQVRAQEKTAELDAPSYSYGTLGGSGKAAYDALTSFCLR